MTRPVYKKYVGFGPSFRESSVKDIIRKYGGELLDRHLRGENGMTNLILWFPSQGAAKFAHGVLKHSLRLKEVISLKQGYNIKPRKGSFLLIVFRCTHEASDQDKQQVAEEVCREICRVSGSTTFGWKVGSGTVVADGAVWYELYIKSLDTTFEKDTFPFGRSILDAHCVLLPENEAHIFPPQWGEKKQLYPPFSTYCTTLSALINNRNATFEFGYHSFNTDDSPAVSEAQEPISHSLIQLSLREDALANPGDCWSHNPYRF